MTGYAPGTDTPAAIDTLEKAAAHSLMTLFDLYKGIEYKEATGTSLDSGLAPLIDQSVISAADGTQRVIFRVAFEVDPAYVTDAGKLWTFINAFGNATVPAAFKVD